MSDAVQTRVGHCKADDTNVYVGRGPGGRDMSDTPIGERGWLGNPYSLDDFSRRRSISAFAIDFQVRVESDPDFAEAVKSLHGKTLGCWCQKLDDSEPACHAEVIATWADTLTEWGETNE